MYISMTNPLINQPQPPVLRLPPPPKAYRPLVIAITGFIATIAGGINFITMYNFPDNAPLEVLTNFFISISFAGTGIALLAVAMATNFKRKSFINFAHNFKAHNPHSTADNYIINPEAHYFVVALNIIGYAVVVLTLFIFTILSQGS